MNEVPPWEDLPTTARDDDVIIDDIERVRRINNRLWMQILRTAMANDPETTGKILKDITSNDRLISKLMEELADENSRS